jgi:hypothetical protein
VWLHAHAGRPLCDGANCALSSAISISLRQREWDHADGQKQNYVKGTAKKMRFGVGVFLFVHFLPFSCWFKSSPDGNYFPSWNARFSQTHYNVSRIFFVLPIF